MIKGDGNAFWAKGMETAEQFALQNSSENDFILWLNDDVVLDPLSIFNLLATHADNPGTVNVGAMRDRNNKITYSGLIRQGLHPLSFRKVEPTSKAMLIDTFHGNLVLVPITIAKALGGIDGNFSHAWADIDYGLRCRKLGFSLVLCPGTYGVCEENPIVYHSSIIPAWKSYLSVKGAGNFYSLKRILAKHIGFFWPIPILISYSLWWLRSAKLKYSVIRKNPHAM